MVRLLILLPFAVALASCKPSSEQAPKGVTVDLPPALPTVADNMTEPMQNVVTETLPKQSTERPQAPAAKTEVEPKIEVAKPKREEPKPSKPKEETKSEPSPPATPDPEPAPAATPKPTAVKLPLSNDRIASTIQRIGYSCGSVASIDPVGGSDTEKAYKIICSSGDAYRGTNRSGHMRFRKWGS